QAADDGRMALLAFPSFHAGEFRIAEVTAVTGPIGIEAYDPLSRGGECHLVELVLTVAEIENHHRAIARPAFVPAVPGKDLVLGVAVEDIHMLAGEPAAYSIEIAPQPDQVAV